MWYKTCEVRRPMLNWSLGRFYESSWTSLKLWEIKKTPAVSKSLPTRNISSLLPWFTLSSIFILEFFPTHIIPIVQMPVNTNVIVPSYVTIQKDKTDCNILAILVIRVLYNFSSRWTLYALFLASNMRALHSIHRYSTCARCNSRAESRSQSSRVSAPSPLGVAIVIVVI